MKVYLVGCHGSEHNYVKSVHMTYAKALKAWNELRIGMLEHAKTALNEEPDEGLWQKIVKSLECEDPKKMDDCPWETPYIHERDVEER